MPDKIIHIRSLTPGSIPTTSNLGVGEIAINVPDGKAFLRQSGSTDTIQSFVTTNSVTSGSIIISGSSTITGTQIITGSDGRLVYTGTAIGVYSALAEIHVNNDDALWLERFYNDTFSTSSASMAYFGHDDGRFVFHNESTQSIGLQVNGFGAENGLLVYEDKVAFVNNVEVTGSLNVVGGITGSLFGTASWATNVITASYITSSNVYGPFGANSIISASYATTASYSNNLQVSGSINNVDYIDFNTGSATPAYRNGRIFWDNTEGALSVYNSEADITLQIGQENWTRVFNDTGVVINNGAPVRITGTHGDHPEVVLAASIQVSGSTNIVNQILGLATHTIEVGTFGYITTQGLVRGLNTNAFNNGDTLYVSSSAGQLTNIPPQAPYEIIPIGQVVKASPGASGIIYVAVEQPTDFSDLSSAKVEGTYSYGDIWSYQLSGSVGVWRHTNQLSGSYGLTGSLTATSFTGSLQGTASFVTASNVYGPFGSNSIISSSYALTASYALSSAGGGGSGFPFAGNAVISGSLLVSGSGFTVTGSAAFSDSIAISTTLVTSSQVTTTGAATTTISTQATGSYRSMFAKYTVSNSTNARAGEFMAVWNAGNIQFTDTSTTDIGDTSALVLTGSLTATNVELRTGVGMGWIVKTQTTYV